MHILFSILLIIGLPKANYNSNSTTCTYPCQCAGTSPSSLWQIFNNSVIMMNINTTVCKFISTPVYFTSIAGIDMDYIMQGYTAIYSPKNDSFLIYAISVFGDKSSTLYSYSQTYSWNINWFGIYYWSLFSILLIKFPLHWR